MCWLFVGRVERIHQLPLVVFGVVHKPASVGKVEGSTNCRWWSLVMDQGRVVGVLAVCRQGRRIHQLPLVVFGGP